MRAHDTSEAARSVQLRLYREMQAERRSAIALEMSDDLRRVAREGIKRRHPEYSEAQVRRALIVLLFGEETARRIWPGVELEAP